LRRNIRRRDVRSTERNYSYKPCKNKFGIHTHLVIVTDAVPVCGVPALFTAVAVMVC
jgi:hypothetical protein